MYIFAFMTRLFLFFIFLVFSFFSQAQSTQYKWPVDAPPALSANFGELRTNHYHMGLDARTLQRENLRVFAAEKGFVSRIKIEPWGFGRAIYIEHPNGITSLYAHLNDFYPELEKWVSQQQYSLSSWQVDLKVPAGLFSVNRGQFIAYSGNTGGSMGPHLHFELRDTKTEIVLNPLIHGFSIADNVAPDVLRLAIYDRRISTYEQSPRIIALKRTGNSYKPLHPVVVSTNKISFGISAYDRYTGSTNQNGIYKGVLYYNGNEQTRFILDSISYDNTRYLNAHIDYKTKAAGGPYIQHLSKLGNKNNSIYKGGDGIIYLADSAPQQIKILVSDTEGNTATIELTVQASLNQTPVPSTKDKLIFRPEMINIFENDSVRLYLSPKAIYDSFYFTYNAINSTGGTVYQIHKPIVPLQEFYKLNLFNNRFADTGKVIMKRYYGSKTDYKKATYQNGWYGAMWRDFGNFQLIYDNEPPVISPVTKSVSRIVFHITDNTEELQNFTATLNGNWIRFSNDKNRAFIYKIDEYCLPGQNELIITVEDLAGNKAERKFTFMH